MSVSPLSSGTSPPNTWSTNADVNSLSDFFRPSTAASALGFARNSATSLSTRHHCTPALAMDLSNASSRADMPSNKLKQ